MTCRASHTLKTPKSLKSCARIYLSLNQLRHLTACTDATLCALRGAPFAGLLAAATGTTGAEERGPGTLLRENDRAKPLRTTHPIIQCGASPRDGQLPALLSAFPQPVALTTSNPTVPIQTRNTPFTRFLLVFRNAKLLASRKSAESFFVAERFRRPHESAAVHNFHARSERCSRCNPERSEESDRPGVVTTSSQPRLPQT